MKNSKNNPVKLSFEKFNNNTLDKKKLNVLFGGDTSAPANSGTSIATVPGVIF